jgi:nitroreductase
MDFAQLMKQRWSCRAFLPEEVPDDLMRRMLSVAQRTASWCNTQPWHVYITRGEATRRFAASLTEYALSRERASDFEMPQEYRGVHLERRRASGYALYASLGIQREDRDARTAQSLKNFEFFGAPHVALITCAAGQGVYGAMDCGGYVANLINAAHSLGLAAVPQAAIAQYSAHAREFFELPDDRLVVCAVSFGRADLEHPVNKFRTNRAEISDAVTVLDH